MQVFYKIYKEVRMKVFGSLNNYLSMLRFMLSLCFIEIYRRQKQIHLNHSYALIFFKLVWKIQFSKYIFSLEKVSQYEIFHFFRKRLQVTYILEKFQLQYLSLVAFLQCIYGNVTQTSNVSFEKFRCFVICESFSKQMI